MRIALVPLKRLSGAKSRLAGYLSSEERSALARALALRTIQALRSSKSIDRIVLVSAETELAHEMGVESSPDTGDLNDSLAQAIGSLNGRAASVMILPADLPLLDGRHIDAFVSTVKNPAGMKIVGTQDGGTGALLLAPPDVIAPAFGGNSLERHMRLALDAGVSVTQDDLAGLSFDLDTREDLQEALERGWSPPTELRRDR